MSVARILAATLLLCAGIICLVGDARVTRARVERNVWHRHLSIEDYDLDPHLADKILREEQALHLGGWIAGMVCLVCAGAVLS